RTGDPAVSARLSGFPAAPNNDTADRRWSALFASLLSNVSLEDDPDGGAGDQIPFVPVYICPSDPDPAGPGGGFPGISWYDRMPRSFMFNGFNDFQIDLTEVAEWSEGEASAMKRYGMKDPSTTALLGEKVSGPDFRGFYVDIYANGTPDNLDDLEQSRHGGSQGRGGSSNYAFADGSARSYPVLGTITPINFWGLRPETRNYYQSLNE
ncbi:MAG: hypothetical protein AAF916_09185, partial [Planctomycetota bacterium]